MHYPWNINGVKANVIEESLHKHWYLLTQKRKKKDKKWGSLYTANTFFEKNYRAFVIYQILGHIKTAFYLEFIIIVSKTDSRR